MTRFRLAFFLFLVSANAANAELNADCRSSDATRAVSGCTLMIQSTGTSRADLVLALVNRAEAFVNQNQLQPAEADLARALQLAPNTSNALAVRGRLNHVKRDYQKAISDYTAALRISANYTYALSNRANSYIEVNNYTSARADLDRAIALDPAYTSALALRGRLNRLDSKLEESVADLDRAIAISPRFVFALLNRADTHQLRGDYAKAVADYDQVLTIQPSNPTATARRQAAVALLQSKGGTVPPAPAQRQTATGPPTVTPGGGAPPTSQAAPASTQQAPPAPQQQARPSTSPPATSPPPGQQQPPTQPRPTPAATPAAPTPAAQPGTPARPQQPGQQQAAAAPGAAGAPVDPQRALQEASALHGRRDFDAAFRLTNQIIQANPNFAAAYLLRGRVLSDANEDQRAQADFDRYIQLVPGDWSGFFFRSASRIDLGRFDDAIADSNEVQRLRPNGIEWGNLRGLAHQRAGRMIQAANEFTAAINVDPKVAQSYVNRAEVRIELRQYPAAEADLAEAFKIDARRADVPALRGEILARQGLMERAEGEFKSALSINNSHQRARFGQQGLYAADAIKQFNALPKK